MAERPAGKRLAADRRQNASCQDSKSVIIAVESIEGVVDLLAVVRGRAERAAEAVQRKIRETKQGLTFV